MSSEQTISARFRSATAAEIDMIAKSYGTTASKWMKGKVEEALEREKEKVKAALSAAASGQSTGNGEVMAPLARSEQQLPGRGDVPSLLEPDGRPGERFFEEVERTISKAQVEPPQSPAAVAQTPIPWKSQPKPGPKPPAWQAGIRSNVVMTQSGPVVEEPVQAPAKFDCDVCNDEGGPGILVECGSCGRYKDQQGKVNESPDGPPAPKDWEAAWSVMEQMGQLERQERFMMLSGGRLLPDNWRALTRVEKIRWLNENWPLS